MSNQFEKKDDGPKPPPHSQHMYARRPAPVVSQSTNLVPLVHPASGTFHGNTSERPPVQSSTSVTIATSRFGVQAYNRPPPAIPPQGSNISQPFSMPIPPQAVMQVSDTLSQQHHLQNPGAVLHHPTAGVNQVLASGLLGQLSLQQLPTSQPQMQAQQQQQSQFQRLKVEDALSYLDQVKFQFGNQPQVYNDFLDIMKEFKSQSIDTPGVIARVSSLFAGHADLIVGFNTFLPPGYKIEVSGNDQVSVTGPNMLPQTINTQHGGSGPPTAIQVHTPQTKYVTPQGQGSQNQTHLTSQPSHVPTPPTSMFAPAGHANQPSLSSSNAASIVPPSTISTAPAGIPLPNTTTTLGGSNVPPAPVLGQQPQVGSQPVEFNHAINYVNKIKHRFQGQTDIYKAFLEILHKYQKEQRTVKETNGAYTPTLSESEVYSQVAKLFKNDEDLLREFGQFLPDAGGGMGSSGNLSALAGGSATATKMENASNNDHPPPKKQPQYPSSSSTPSSTSSSSTSSKSSRTPVQQSLKRSSALSTVQGKKIRSCSLKDVSLAEASKHGTLAEFAFFDKVRRALGSQEVYDNFLRCILLFTNDIIGTTELVQLAQPFLMKFPELFGWFKTFMKYKDGQTGENWSSVSGLSTSQSQSSQAKEKHEGMAMEIDYTTLKRLGSSYRALPTSLNQLQCSGRDALCREVLNDMWVSFPSWSEDSQSVTSKKTQFEEHVYRCEDERFELDVVLETNLATILVLEAVNKDLLRMSEEEKSKFKLDNCLGGTSEVIHRKAIHRIYGDKAPDIIDGLKKNPAVAVPVVLKRLKMKDEEWREAQHQFNKVWREQNEKYYLKSLDHQGINFKQNDTRFLRSKTLLNEIENLFDERQEALESGTNSQTLQGPHMTLTYEDKSMMDDCASLIIHHVKRQSGIHKDDKQKMKIFMYQTLPDLFFSPRGNQPSDDDDDEDDCSDSDSKSTSSRNSNRNGKNSSAKQKPKSKITGGYSLTDNLDGMYHHFMCNNPFYLFFRLHEVLCARLLKIYKRAEILADEDAKEKKENGGKESVSDMLKLKQVNDIEVIEYYPAFLEMVRNLLDGNIEGSQYEDQLRDMFTIHAYIAFTMDRLIINIVRQLQHIVQDEQCSQLIQYYIEEEKNNATGGHLVSAIKRQQQETNYQRRVEQLLTEENCFKVAVLQKKSQLHVEIELIDTEDDQDEVAELAESAKWSDYVEKYLGELQDDLPNQVKEKVLKKPPVFMQRNAMTYRRQKKRERDETEESKEADKEKMLKKRRRLYCTGEMEVTFNRNSYKMNFVPGTEFVLYSEDALKKAKDGQEKRNKALHDKFQAKVSEWGRENVSRDMSRQCTNWLMGKIPGQGGSMEELTNCTTVCKAEKIGMVSRNRYLVEYHNEGKSSANA